MNNNEIFKIPCTIFDSFNLIIVCLATTCNVIISFESLNAFVAMR